MANAMTTPTLRYAALTGVTALLAVAACASIERSALPPPDERGHAPWVFRSVLDRHPRMITFALAKDLWAAYDTQHAALYKVWRDGVEFDGAVYTTRHGPQPSSDGAGYIVNDLENPWRILLDGREMTPRVQYLGHRFADRHASLRYALLLDDGRRIEIEEWPESVRAADGRATFYRRFDILRNEPNARIVLLTRVQSIDSEADIRSNGALAISERTAQAGDLSLNARLALRPSRTTLATVFAHEPTVVPASASEPEDPAVAIMEGSDCNVCHNPTQQTVGPSYRQIALRYTTSDNNIQLLAQKIIAGGAGAWGNVPMSPHPEMPPADARLLAAYVLAFDREDADGIELGAPAQPQARTRALPKNMQPGVTLRYYELADPVAGVPVIERDEPPSKIGVVPVLAVTKNPSSPGEYSFEEFQDKQKFVVHASGMIEAERTGTYRFRIDDGSGDARLFIGSRKLIETQGNSAPHATIELAKGWHPFTLEYANSAFHDWHMLQLLWTPPGEPEAIVPAAALATTPPDREAVTPGFKRYTTMPPYGVPGDQTPLQGVHPSFRLVNIRPKHFEPKVAGMDFLSDGRLVLSTWSADGAVYLLDGVRGEDPNAVTIKQIASGLAEPLGLKVVDDQIFVMQKQELTQLIDHDGDEIIDEYRLISNAWQVSDNFHEFAFGLLYEDGGFYATLASAVLPGGAPAKPQTPDRGKLVRIDRATGKVTTVARGLRTPNGIGYGADGEKFIADNQGNWLPSSKIVHVREGAFYGFREVDPERDAGLSEQPPVAWLPQDEIGNSPTNPVPIPTGVYQGQMMHGEVTHGGLKRVFVEKIDGEYQGCVFRFVQGLEAGVNRTTWGPDGALYVGGVGNPGNWSQPGKLHYGLQKLVPTGAAAFEMLAIRIKSSGVEIEFTKPLRAGDGLRAEDYEIRQWRYVPTEAYGGPKVDERPLRVRSVRRSEDRRRVFLELEGMQAQHVLYVRIANPFLSDDDEEMWTTESWCTVNAIPADAFLAAEKENPRSTSPTPNTLTPAEAAAGWKLLFDGSSTKGWRNFQRQSLDRRWRAVDGELTLTSGGGGDIVTEAQFEDFELQFEWRISPGGNSGVLYRVREEGIDEIWHGAPEMQLLDDDGHPDGRIPSHRAGANYDLQIPAYSVTKPVGEYNIARIVVDDGHVTHWLNGRKLIEYRLWSDKWEAMVKASKFAKLPSYGRAHRGHIAFQDHGDRVWFRNIRIREL